MSKYILILLSFFLVNNAFTQSTEQIRAGNRNYRAGNFEGAEEQYRRAIQGEPNSFISRYNLGNALHEQHRYEEAVKHYSAAAAIAKSDRAKADAFYNIGNAYLGQENLSESVNAYKQALRLNPKDMQAKNNLSHVLEQTKIERPSQDQSDEEEEGRGRGGGDDDDSDDELLQDMKKEKEEKLPQYMSEEEALRLLRIIEKEDEKVQQKLRKGDGERSKSDKDW